MAIKSKFLKNWPKHLLQWGVLITLILVLTGVVKLSKNAADPEAWCPMGGLQALTTFLAKGTLPCTMSSVQVMMGIVLAAAIILFSKLFCSYLCPIGTVEDFLSGLRKKLGWKKGLYIRNGSVLDKILRILKYALLFVIFYSTVSASELFCKHLDPYYAVATGFKGEITLWMSITSIVLVVLGGFLIDRFWCRYICPLGAVSDTCKYWVALVVFFGLTFAAGAAGVNVNWVAVLAVFCFIGYILEIFYPNPKLHLLKVVKDENRCVRCHACTRHCPYHIDIEGCNGCVNNVDCNLCGECVASCSTGALKVGVGKKAKGGFWKYVPALLTVVLTAVGIWAGTLFELPTINVKWGLEQTDSTGKVVAKLVPDENLATIHLDGLRSVKCYGSSMAFKAKLEKINGVHGVKTYVGHHKADVLVDTTVIDKDKLQEAIFTPSMFRIATPDREQTDSVKIVTIRTENMYDKMDLNYLGLQIRNTGKKVFGIESEFACPMIVRVYMDPAEELDEAWFKDIVEMKVLIMPVHGGGTKETPVNFKFVKLEPDAAMMSTEEYLQKIFAVSGAFKAEFKSRVAQYEGKPQFVYEIVDNNYEKPIVRRNMPFLSNHLSKEEGIIGVYLALNKDYLPSIQIRFASPMTADRIWELITMDTWTVKYSEDDVREVGAKLKFTEKGTVHSWDK